MAMLNNQMLSMINYVTDQLWLWNTIFLKNTSLINHVTNTAMRWIIGMMQHRNQVLQMPRIQWSSGGSEYISKFGSTSASAVQNGFIKCFTYPHLES